MGFLLGAFVALKGFVLAIPSGTWQPTGNLSAARPGASAALLQNGSVLITGGDPGSGPVASADLFNSDGSVSPLATPMNNPRSNHISTTLQDGRVLVAGGTVSGGGATNSAEIYDPLSGTWTSIAGGMVEARSGAAAALLQDGRVLIAGGESSGVASTTLEIFDPVAGTFSAAGVMSSPRTKHAVAVLADGRVIIIGGSNGTAPVASTDILNPVSGSVAAGPSLATPRSGHSATTLLDGRVLIVGGNSIVTNADSSTTTVDLTSAEIFDPTAGMFTTSASALATARAGHLAFLLPHNNNVLIVGGTSNGVSISSAELFTPWQGTFSATSSLSTARSNAAGSPMRQDGLLLVAGGKDAATPPNALASTEVYGFATVKTDKADYAPGEIVTITGSGWQPGETVTLSFLESPLIDTHPNLTAVADSNGNISNNQFAPDAHDVGILFYLTAAGQTSARKAQTTFADAGINKITTVGAQTPTPVPAGNSATYSVTVTFNGNTTPCNATLSTSALPAGASASFAPIPSGNSANTIRGIGSDVITTTLTITTTAGMTPVTTTFTITATPGIGCNAGTASTNPGGTGGNAANPTLAISKANQTITFGALSAKIYGDAPFTVSATASSGLAVSFASTTTAVCTTSGTNGSTVTIVAQGTCSIKASQAGNTNYNAAPDVPQSFTVNPATLTYKADAKTRAYGVANPPFTGTVTGFVNGDTQTSATTGTLTFSSSATTASNVGSYAINGSGLTANNGNYTFVQAASNATALTITQVTLTASIIGNPTKPYDGTTTATLASGNFSLSPLVGSENFTVTQTAGSLRCPQEETERNCPKRA